MEVTINIPMEGGSTTSVKEIMDALTIEDKKEIASGVVKEWLQNDFDMEKDVYEKKVMKSIRDKTGYNSVGANATDEKVRKHYDFRTKMNSFKSTRDQLIEDIISEMKGEVKDHIMDVVKDAEQTKAIKAKIEKEVLDELPKMVMAMFSAHLVDNFSRSFAQNFEIDNMRDSINRITEQSRYDG